MAASRAACRAPGSRDALAKTSAWAATSLPTTAIAFSSPSTFKPTTGTTSTEKPRSLESRAVERVAIKWYRVWGCEVRDAVGIIDAMAWEYDFHVKHCYGCELSARSDLHHVSSAPGMPMHVPNQASWPVLHAGPHSTTPWYEFQASCSLVVLASQKRDTEPGPSFAAHRNPLLRLDRW